MTRSPALGLGRVIKRSSLSAYADDTQILHADKDPLIVQELINTDLSHVDKWYEDNGMKRNPSKYQAIVMGKTQTKPEFRSENTVIPISEELDLLGVTIDDKLKFDKHVAKICRIRFLFKDKNTPYKELLNALGRTTLVEHRVRKIASTVFKLINSKSPICLNELIKPRTSSYELRGKDALRLPKVNTTKYGLKSWHYLAPKIWNNIPDAAKSCTTYKAFLKRLSDTDISRHC